MTDYFEAALEIKSFGNDATGEFAGYASVFHHTDRLGDLLLPGSFTDTLAERKALGRPIPMHFNHGLAEIGGQRGIGRWLKTEEDQNGLAVEGKISGMNTDGGRLLFERVKDRAIGGLSIGFKPHPSGVVYGSKAGQPRRTIKAVHLGEISLTDEPVNSLSTVLSVKSAALLGRGSDTIFALNEIKSRVQAGDMPKLRELQDAMRDAFGFSNAQAEKVANLGLKALTRESDGLGDASPEVKALLGELLSGAKNFHFPTSS